MSKDYQELAVELVQAWLQNDSEVYQEIGETSMKGEAKSVKEIAQAYLDFSNTIIKGDLPNNLVDEDESIDE